MTYSTCSNKYPCAGLFTVSHRRNNKTLNIGPFCRNMLLSQGHLSALSSVKITYPKWMINSETEAATPPTRIGTKTSSGGSKSYWSVKNQTPSEIRSSSMTDNAEASQTLYLQCITVTHMWCDPCQSESNITVCASHEMYRFEAITFSSDNGM